MRPSICFKISSRGHLGEVCMINNIACTPSSMVLGVESFAAKGALGIPNIPGEACTACWPQACTRHCKKHARLDVQALPAEVLEVLADDRDIDAMLHALAQVLPGSAFPIPRPSSLKQ